MFPLYKHFDSDCWEPSDCYSDVEGGSLLCCAAGEQGWGEGLSPCISNMPGSALFWMPIIFCLTSRIFNWRVFLLTNTSLCSAKNALVASPKHKIINVNQVNEDV